MTKYTVFGLGNALVDQEFEVTDAFLQSQGIEKGLMTLVEDEQHVQLLDQLTNTFGIKKRAGGGSAANTLVGLCQFGGSAFYACKVGDDESGRFYVEDLANAGVTTRIGELDLHGQTGKCMVMVTADAERTMNTYLGITSDLSPRELFKEEIEQADYLYIEGYLVTSESAQMAIADARAIAKDKNLKIAMTFSDPAMVKYFKEGVDKALGTDPIDLLFCNEEEALTFSDTSDYLAAGQALLARAKMVAMTRGSDGASIFTANDTVSVPAQPVQAVDSNGAGDMFAGAFLYGLSQNWSTEQSATLACHAAAVVVSHFGPRISAEQQQQILAELSA